MATKKAKTEDKASDKAEEKKEAVEPVKSSKKTKDKDADATQAAESEQTDTQAADDKTGLEDLPLVQQKVTKAGRRSAKAIREDEAETKRKAAAAVETKPVSQPAPKINPLKRHGKNYRAALELVDRTKHYELEEAIELAKQTAKVKFDASVELHVNLGVDPRQADQMVRASVTLPAGTGKSLRVAVLGTPEQQKAATAAGADVVGEADLLASIEQGKFDFDRLITTPEHMPKLAKLAKLLGPRGLMPNPKSGTVTSDVAEAVRQAKAGQVEFRIDKQAIIHQLVGKVSFSNEDLLSNITTLLHAIARAKPAATKGTFVKAISLTTAMGPGIKLAVQPALAAANPKR